MVFSEKQKIKEKSSKKSNTKNAIFFFNILKENKKLQI
jgi:hypothetical protein